MATKTKKALQVPQPAPEPEIIVYTLAELYERAFRPARQAFTEYAQVKADFTEAVTGNPIYVMQWDAAGLASAYGSAHAWWQIMRKVNELVDQLAATQIMAVGHEVIASNPAAELADRKLVDALFDAVDQHVTGLYRKMYERVMLQGGQSSNPFHTVLQKQVERGMARAIKQAQDALAVVRADITAVFRAAPGVYALQLTPVVIITAADELNEIYLNPVQ